MKMKSILICGLILALGLCAIADFEADKKMYKDKICKPDLDKTKLENIAKCLTGGKGDNEGKIPEGATPQQIVLLLP